MEGCAYLILALVALPGLWLGKNAMTSCWAESFFPWRAHLAPVGQLQPLDNAFLTDSIQLFGQNVLIGQCLKAGELPLWDPSTFCGHPLQANGQAAVFYLPKLLLSLALPPLWAQNVFLLLHLWLAGWVMHRLLARWVFSPWAAALAGISWMLGGYLATRAEMVSFVAYGPILPLAFMAAERLLTRPDGRAVAALAAALALSQTAGNFQCCAYLYYAVGSFLLWRIVAERWPSKTVLAAFFAVVLSLTLGAAQLLPTIELSRLSGRPGFSVAEHLSSGRFFPENFLTLLVPQILGSPEAQFYLARMRSFLENPLELSVHVGGAALLLAVYAASGCRRDRVASFFVALVVVTLLIASGTPLFTLLHAVAPGFKQFTYTRILFLTGFGLSALAGLGLERALTQRGRRPTWLVAFPVLATLTVAWAIWQVQTASGLFQTLMAALRSSGVDLLCLPNYCGMDAFRKLLASNIGNFYKPTNPQLWVPVVTLWAAWALLGRSPRWLALVSIPELLLFFWSWNPMIDASLLDGRAEPSLHALASTHRVVGFGRSPYPQMLTTWGIRDAGGSDGMYPGYYHDFFCSWQSAPTLQYNVLTLTRWTPHTATWARMMGIDVIYTDPLWPALALPGWSVERTPELTLYHSPDSLGPAWLVGERIVSPSFPETLQRMQAADFDPARVVFLDRPLGDEIHNANPGTVRQTETGPNQLDFLVNASGPCLLVQNDLAYPGWQATLDGQKTPMAVADGVFRAVAVPAGEHQVGFRFQPRSLRLGLTLSALSLLLLLGLAVEERRRR